MCPPVAKIASLLPRTVFYNGPILDGAGNQCQTDLDLSAAMLATRKFWFQPLLSMILNGQNIWNNTKPKPKHGRTFPHPGWTTWSEPFLPPTTPPQVQMAYPMQHGGFILARRRKPWLLILMTSVDQLSLPLVQFKHGSREPKWAPPLIISVHWACHQPLKE